MNGFAVQDAWAKAYTRERDRNSSALTRSAEQSERAQQWVKRNLPDLVQDGQPCTFAVRAVIDVTAAARRGELALPDGKRPEQVRERSRRFGDEVRRRRQERFGHLLAGEYEQLTLDQAHLQEVGPDA